MFNKNDFKDKEAIKKALKIMKDSFMSAAAAVEKVETVASDPNSSDDDIEKEFIFMIHKINSIEKNLTP